MAGYAGELPVHCQVKLMMEVAHGCLRPTGDSAAMRTVVHGEFGKFGEIRKTG